MLGPLFAIIDDQAGGDRHRTKYDKKKYGMMATHSPYTADHHT